ncbi:glycosyltransferase family 2 protein [Mycobacterium sp. 050134]|uniref:glycosyltransferase family 2 protein n=1 Tax=Mycobacterium sp. 050134 TaxID=3096111 RepID=UPI002EDA8D7B
MARTEASDRINMPPNPVISVCVPMYNNSATIERCLGSILDQDGIDFEILVVDDDSADDGAAIAAQMLRPGDRLVRNAPRLGLNQNHNRCLDLARGRYIQFVHGDDWLLPGALRTLAHCFEDPAVGMAFAPRLVVSSDVGWQERFGTLHNHFRELREHNHGPSLVSDMVLRGRGFCNWIGEPTCVMFRRQLALDAGGFRADIYQLVDLDLWLRLMLRSAVRFVPVELSVRRHSGTTATNQIVTTRRWWLDQLRILTWMLVDPKSPAATRAAAAIWWLPTWLRLSQDVLLHRPYRWQRAKTLAEAPFYEFARARRLREALPAAQPTPNGLQATQCSERTD